MNVPPYKHFLNIFMLMMVRILGRTKVRRMVGNAFQITCQVSSKVNGIVIKVTNATISMYDTIAEEMLIPIKVVENTSFASDSLKSNLPRRASMTLALKWTNPPSRESVVKIAAITTPAKFGRSTNYSNRVNHCHAVIARLSNQKLTPRLPLRALQKNALKEHHA